MKIHVSKRSAEILQMAGFELKDRGMIPIKGKGNGVGPTPHCRPYVVYIRVLNFVFGVITELIDVFPLLQAIRTRGGS